MIGCVDRRRRTLVRDDRGVVDLTRGLEAAEAGVRRVENERMADFVVRD